MAPMLTKQRKRKRVARPTGPRVVVGYVRVSTRGQAEDGVSLTEQEARVRAWAAARGLEVAGVYRDEGISGKSAHNRPGLLEAIAETCRLGGVLIVASLSRVARSTRDLLEIAERVKECGGSLASASEDFDTGTTNGRLLFGLLAVLAEFERSLLSDRTKAALAHLRAQGKRAGVIPYGQVEDALGNVRPCQQEQKIISRIVSLRSQGLTLRAIASTLEGEGVKAKRGGSRWSPKVLLEILEKNAPLSTT